MVKVYLRSFQATRQRLDTRLSIFAFIIGLMFAGLMFVSHVSTSDTDGDGIANEQDLDDDNDGLTDVEEGLCDSEVVNFEWGDHYTNGGYEDPADNSLSIDNFRLTIDRIDESGITEASDIRDANGFTSAWYIQQDPVNIDDIGIYKIKSNYLGLYPLS